MIPILHAHRFFFFSPIFKTLGSQSCNRLKLTTDSLKWFLTQVMCSLNKASIECLGQRDLQIIFVNSTKFNKPGLWVLIFPCDFRISSRSDLVLWTDRQKEGCSCPLILILIPCVGLDLLLRIMQWVSKISCHVSFWFKRCWMWSFVIGAGK